MSFLKKLFGSKQPEKFSHWYDIGDINLDLLSEFSHHGEQILQSLGRKGTLSKFIVREPIPGHFGKSQQEFSKTVIQWLLNYAEDQSGISITSIGTEPIQTPALPDYVRKAMKTGQIIFMVGTTSDGRRNVGLLVLE